MLYKATAPGCLMLLGEYAVLHGKHALVCAVNQRMTVTLTPRTDQTINIISALGHLETNLSHLVVAPPFQFVIAVLKKFRKKLQFGCDIVIDSEFSDQIGFGSSAAVTVAVTAALAAWLEISLSPEDLIRHARETVRKVQSLGSGADVAACVLGGVVAYKMQPLRAEKILCQPPITAIYSGYKTPTVEAVNLVRKGFMAYPKIMKQVLQSIDLCVLEAIQALRDKNWVVLGKIMNIQQGLMDSLGVSTAFLNDLIYQLREQSSITGAKISGSGLGDCVIGLGSTDALQFANEKVKQIPIEVTTQGVYCEKI